jgi:diguanylate cyclase (GGDEF)-like protein
MEEQLSSHLQTLKETTITDDLTRLYNRRHLFEEGYRYVHMIRRTHIPLACLMLDIDHFKEINDTHGHAVGDQILRAVSREMRESIRETDFAARYGGEEFVILAYRADRDQALHLAERLRAAIADQIHSTEAGELRITVSIGVALLNEDTRAARKLKSAKLILDRLLRYADDALYQAKAEGRNCVYSGETVKGE